MLKRLILAVLSALLVAEPASAAYLDMIESQSSASMVVTSTLTTSDYLRTPARGFMRIAFTQGATLAGTFYACATNTYAASTCTSKASVSASNDALEITTGRAWLIFDPTTAETAGQTSYITVQRNLQNAGGGGGSSVATQSAPSNGETYAKLTGSIDDPATATFGFGINFGTVGAFTRETYPGSGINVSESDNLFGPYYNAPPCSAIRTNIYEHAFEDCIESNYSSIAGTASDPWVEFNLDVEAPDVLFGMSGITGTPVAGNYAVFSGGGTCKILNWSSPNLACRMSYGATAVGQTVTWAGGGATVGSAAAINDTYTNRWRPHQFKWDTIDMLADHEFNTDASYGYPTLMLRNGTARIGTNDFPQAELLLGNTPWPNSLQTIGPAIIGYGGVKLSHGSADSGKLTLLGVGTGADEDFTIDLNTTANEVGLSSSTGATTLRASFDLIATSFSSSAVASPSITLDDSVATDSNAESKIDGDATADDNGRIAFGVEAGTDGTYELPLIVRSVSGASTAELGRVTDGGSNYWKIAEGGVMTPQGTASIQPGGGSTANGSAIWAISDGGSFDTGTEVCTKSGRALTCQSVINFAALGVSPASVACGTAITNTHTFIAMCY